jgi:hypothetical protein
MLTKIKLNLKEIVMLKYIKSLIKSGTGDSSKSFFLVMVTIIGFILLGVVGFVMVYDVLYSGAIISDLYGLATIIGAITTLFTSAGLCKVIGEKNEIKRNCGCPQGKHLPTCNDKTNNNDILPVSDFDDTGSIFDKDFSNED